MKDDQHIWSYDTLFAKAKLYVQRAADADAGSSVSALWSLMAFELLARAALAKVHAVLLADPQQGTQLLYAFGYGNPQHPRSVPAATVLRRCQVVVGGFTESDVRDGSALLNLRNAEVHSGGTVLEEVKSSAWMPQYYRLSEILLEHLEAGLDDFFPQAEAETAEQMIAALAEDVESDVKQRVADKQREFEGFSSDEQEQRRQRGIADVILQLDSMRTAECPACGTRGFVRGEVSEFSQPKVGETHIERTATVFPTQFACRGCGLELGSHAEMLHAGLGDQYSVTESEDPIEYYGIDPTDYVDIPDLYEPDPYGND